MNHYALFETEIGWAGLVWGPQGLTGVQLPHREQDGARRELLRRYPDAAEAPPPAAIASVAGGICALLRGEKVDLSDAPLDLDRVPAFNAKVYAIARAIPPGRTLT